MASYSTIKYGSRGSDVRQLQTMLNNAGYSLNVDGIFGDKTRAAVREYQQANGLSVDGIVGQYTWGALSGGGSGTSSSGGASGSGGAYAGSGIVDVNTPYSPVGVEYGTYSPYGQQPAYSPSSSVTGAQNALAEYENNRPGPYVSSYQEQLDTLYNQIMGRGAFTYDPQTDPMYELYKDKYTKGGQLAMQDTMANATALTGGYGNSYAQTVGQQQYNEYMSALADVLPQLEERAYGRWQDEGQDLYNRFGLTQGRDEGDYGRYRDVIGDYYNDLGYAYNRYQDYYQNDYNQYLNDLALWQNNRDFAYQQQQDAQAQQNYLAELELARSQSSGSGGGGSSSGSRSSGSGSGSGTKQTGAQETKGTVEVDARLESLAFPLFLKYGPDAMYMSPNDLGLTNLTKAQRQYVYSLIRQLTNESQMGRRDK